MEEKKKLSTAEILARARAQKAAAAGETPAEADPAAVTPAAEAASPTETPAVETPAAKPAAPAAPGGAPKSTKDILAAARAQAAAKAAGGSAPAAAAPAAAPAAAKPAAGGAKSTKDILAAARAQAAAKAAGGEPAAAESAAATKVAAAKPAAKPAAGGTPSVQEMLKAVREGKAAEAEAPAAQKPVVAAKIPTKPPAPSKTPVAKAPAAKGKVESGPRRNFLLAILGTPFALAWTLLTITGLAAVLGAARFMFPNAIVEPPSKFKVGPPGDYPNGTVSNKWKAMFGIWIVNADYQGKSLIYALSTVCTHLGCTPSWLDGEQKFKCPCHGSGFYISGINFEGPAPRPLERYAIRVAEDGMLEVDKSQKFQQEIGQWDDPKSFVEIA